MIDLQFQVIKISTIQCIVDDIFTTGLLVYFPNSFLIGAIVNICVIRL